jgi:hypothetical protein
LRVGFRHGAFSSRVSRTVLPMMSRLKRLPCESSQQYGFRWALHSFKTSRSDSKGSTASIGILATDPTHRVPKFLPRGKKTSEQNVAQTWKYSASFPRSCSLSSRRSRRREYSPIQTKTQYFVPICGCVACVSSSVVLHVSVIRRQTA